MRRLFAILIVMLHLAGCASLPQTPFRPSTGFIYTEIKAPLTTNFNNHKIVRTYGQATSTYVAYSIFGFSVGDVSLKKAIKDGVLENAKYADYEWFSILSMYGKLKVNVYGDENLEGDE